MTPLTPDELAELRERMVENIKHARHQTPDDVPALLATVAALEAEVKRLREIAERCEDESTDLHRADGYRTCMFCGVNGRAPLYHNAGCLFYPLRARAALTPSAAQGVEG